jgi:hypothetical protein
MFRADEYGEILLEGIEIRACWCDPIGLESFQDEFDFGTADVGRGEVKTRERHESGKIKSRGDRKPDS